MGRGWDIVGRWLLPLVLVVSLVGLGYGGYALWREAAAQRGIDAHTQRVTGTVTRVSVGLGLYARQRSTVDFTIDGRPVTTGLRGLPADVSSGASVCLEVDAERPTWARLCGTRGGVDAAQRDVLLVGIVVLVSGGLWALYLWRRRAVRRRSEPALAA
jgi:hypothetical protein